ncbi:hypothetical protein KFL_002040140 [Klebsormidium nitens]|uniref:Methyltransferase domain-containing protein n=1 Tax=Klebsormidium nitens TaxID=105231 RepID=A0A1Y1I1G5_KLENI|nr:hypothetical protein KFL_002040140 [Klebsormidium nitens]|eukprot:GAQ84755.1 hypothetical protein KFL_002040140 [Klebsormidium nitens]
MESAQWKSSVVTLAAVSVAAIVSLFLLFNKGSGPSQYSASWIMTTHHNYWNGAGATAGGLHYCKANPFMIPELFGDYEGIVRAEEAALEWSKNLLAIDDKLYEGIPHLTDNTISLRESHEPGGHKRFNSVHLWEAKCLEIERMGGVEAVSGDGGKLLCGIDRIMGTQPDCTVFSLGSNNDFSFEDSIAKTTKCHLQTFDCTVRQPRVPDDISDRVTFHQICLGTAKETKGELEFMSIVDVAALLGQTSPPNLFKMDIEGGEWDVFQDLLRSESAHLLPYQLSLELHWCMSGRRKTVADVAMLMHLLYDVGYRVISREDNVLCECCTELTFIRAFC